MATALITGASRGFGLALAHELASRGWNLLIDGRDATSLRRASEDLQALAHPARVIAITGDVSHATHRDELAGAVEELGGVDLLVNNAGVLGPSPLPPLGDVAVQALREVIEVNTIAPLALMQRLRRHLLASHATIVNLTSDAAVEAYPGWGVYGASKAALDHLSAVLAVELPQLTVLSYDPGDLRTDLHQAAFPGEDISDRPHPREAVPPLLHLLELRRPSGRYRATDQQVTAGGVL